MQTNEMLIVPAAHPRFTFGMTELDATFGVTAGVSWMFKAWSL